jgi:hypothetical protein
MPDAPTWFIDSSSTKASTTPAGRAGYAIVEGYSNNRNKQPSSYNYLPTGRTVCSYTSITEGKRQNSIICIYSKYTYNIIHSNNQIWKE